MAEARNIQAKPEKKEDVSIAAKLNTIIQKNRRGLFVGLVAILVILAGFIIFSAVNGKLKAAAFSRLDGLERRYEELRSSMGSDDPEAASKQADIDALIADIDAFSRSNSGFAAARGYAINAGIYEARKNWAEAEAQWHEVTKAAAKTYLEPISVFNAAVAAEEQGNIDSAIEFYTKAMNYDSAFPGAAKAQFSIGRLEETRKNNKEAALEAYRNLVSKWPADPVWANLAQSRIVVLSN